MDWTGEANAAEVMWRSSTMDNSFLSAITVVQDLCKTLAWSILDPCERKYAMLSL